MSGKLGREIQQTKPFASQEEEAFLNLGRTWEFLLARLSGLLKRFELTPTQYNLLRILRGAGSAGITCSQACERMITPEPDITRLLDRMEVRGLISRQRSEQDRRVVITRITSDGSNLLSEVEPPLMTFLQERLGHIGPARLNDLIETLELLRTPGS